MSDNGSDQLVLCSDTEPDGPKLATKMRDAIKGWLFAHQQPSADEILVRLEKQLGWEVRHSLAGVIADMRQDKALRSYLRDYLTITLSDEEIELALRGGAKPRASDKSTLDDLFRRSLLYRNSHKFAEAIDFAAKFREYAPYNNMLVRIQNPSCSYYATGKDWWDRFERRIKEDGKPMLILAPMHPVMLVYDVEETEGKALPAKLLEFNEVRGEFSVKCLYSTLENADRLRITVQQKSLPQLHGGFVTTRLHDQDYKIRIVVRKELDPAAAYCVLCHELAHVLLGHLGSDKDHWWPYRINLSHAAVEIEAESVSYIVATRLGLETESPAYLASHAAGGKIPESVSLDLIVKVAGKLEEMSQRLLPRKKSNDHSSGPR